MRRRWNEILFEINEKVHARWAGKHYEDVARLLFATFTASGDWKKTTPNSSELIPRANTLTRNRSRRMQYERLHNSDDSAHTHTPNAQRKVCVDFCSLFIPCIVSIIDRRASRVCMCIRVYHLLLAVTFRLPAHCCTRDNNGVPFLSSNYFSSI